MIAQHFTVIAREDDHSVAQLSAALQGAQHAPDIVVDLLDHGVVGGLDALGAKCFRSARGGLEVDGA